MLADEDGRLVGEHAVQHGKTGEGGARPAVTTVAGGLYSFILGATPYLAKRISRVVLIRGQAEVRPAKPPRIPAHGWWRLGEQVQPELGNRVIGQRSAQSAPSREAVGWQVQHAAP